jgi:hypothetical protein
MLMPARGRPKSDERAPGFDGLDGSLTRRVAAVRSVVTRDTDAVALPSTRECYRTQPRVRWHRPALGDARDVDHDALATKCARRRSRGAPVRRAARSSALARTSADGALRDATGPDAVQSYLADTSVGQTTLYDVNAA